MHISTPFYATCPASSAAIRIQTAMCFHRFPVGERFQDATDKGKITKSPLKTMAHFVAFGVALPEKEDGGSELGRLLVLRRNSQ